MILATRIRPMNVHRILSTFRSVRRLRGFSWILKTEMETPLAPVLAFIVFSEIPGIETLVGGSVVLIAILLSAGDRVK